MLYLFFPLQIYNKDSFIYNYKDHYKIFSLKNHEKDVFLFIRFMFKVTERRNNAGVVVGNNK